MDRVASEYYLWSLEGKPVSVHLSLDVVHALQPFGHSSTGDRPREEGGVLLGRVRQVNDCYIVSVDAAEVIECQHTRGASWILSARDKQAVLRSIRRQHGSLSVVGWFRTHTRQGLYLDQHDFNLFTEFFAHPSSVSLLMRPEDREAAFFFWENGDIRRSSPYQTFPFIPQALGTRYEAKVSNELTRARGSETPARLSRERKGAESKTIELIAIPAGAGVWGRRVLYAAPILAGVLAGFFWQPSIERRRAVEVSREIPAERTVIASPELRGETPVEPSVTEAEPPAVTETPVVRRSRPKPTRKMNVAVARPRRVVTPEPQVTAQPPSIAATARLDAVPLIPQKTTLPSIREEVREEKPSKVRRVIGSIPLLGFLKKKRQPKVDDEAVSPRRLDGSVASSLTSPEAGLSSRRPLRSGDSAAGPRKAEPVVR